MDLEIDRKVWWRGHITSLLLENVKPRQRQQCCVGIYLTACGIPDEALCDVAVVGFLNDAVLPKEAMWLINETDSTNALYAANDNERIDDAEREPEIAALFAKHGVNVTFIGD